MKTYPIPTDGFCIVTWTGKDGSVKSKAVKLHADGKVSLWQYCGLLLGWQEQCGTVVESATFRGPKNKAEREACDRQREACHKPGGIFAHLGEVTA